MVDVYEAVTSRRAVRGFTDKEVPREVLERVVSAAAMGWNAPCGARTVSPSVIESAMPSTNSKN